jgi:hypothetical protein
MPSDMKIIMEGWRSHINEEAAEEIQTVGQLRAAINKAREDKKKGIVGKGAINVLSSATGIDLIQSLGSMLKDVYRLPDEKRTNTFLDRLDVDDDVSDIVDDAIENMFLNDASKEFEGLPDDTRLDQIDMTQRLSDFIAKRFNQRTVSVPDDAQ